MSVMALPIPTTPRRTTAHRAGLEGIARRYAELRRAMPWARVHYPVRVDPAPEVLSVLAELGASFEVTGPAELDRCRALGIPADRLSAVATDHDLGYAAGEGVPLVIVDRPEPLERVSPATTVLVQIEGTEPGHPPTRPGRGLPEAESLLLVAARAGHPVGVAMSVGTRADDVDAWSGPIHDAGWLARRLRGAGYELVALDLGGGLPAGAPVGMYGALIRAAMAAYLGDRLPGSVLVSPGRFLLGEARLHARRAGG